MRVDRRTARFVLGNIVVLVTLWAGSQLASADEVSGKVVPLDPEAAEALELFGEGVVGKPLPSAPLEELVTHLNLAAGDWHYEIVGGEKKAGKKVRKESYVPIPVPGGGKSWKRVIGEEFVEYLHVDAEGNLAKVAKVLTKWPGQ